MKNQEKIIKFEIFSIVFVSILGTLLHFVFEWSNRNMLVAAFSSVNESTWEHLKLVFYPMLISSIIGYFYIARTVPSFLCARIYGILTSMFFIMIFFFTYTGILGTNIAILNIATFFIAVIIGEYISYKILLSYYKCDNVKALISLLVLLFCFIIFTYFPPQLGLFKDPVSGEYGIINVS